MKPERIGEIRRWIEGDWHNARYGLEKTQDILLELIVEVDLLSEEIQLLTTEGREIVPESRDLKQ